MTEGKSAGAIAKKVAKIIFGLLIILVGLGTYLFWFAELVQVFKGLFGIVLIVLGLILIALGWTD